MNKMKIATTVVLVFNLLTFKLQANEGRFTVHAVDETGRAITGAVVKAQFMLAGMPGAGWGDYKLNNVEGITDAGGKCIITGKGDDSSASAGIFKDGYYVNTCRIAFTNSQLGRWQPWNPTVEVVLKKIGIQVPMYAKKVWQAQIPSEGKPVGYDLIVGDWVAANGKGQIADLLFTFIRQTNGVVEVNGRAHQLYDNSLSISFSNSGDGIQSVSATGSGLKLPRKAPTNGYSPKLIKRDFETVTNITSETRVVRHSDFNGDANYFFRVRAKADDKGNITNALYGKIYGDFGGYIDMGKTMFRLNFTYYLNPEPDSRDMEFNTKSNLFNNLPPLEQVSAP